MSNKLFRGKRYRVVLEGVAQSENILVVSDTCWLYSNAMASATEIKELPEPVVTFVPGDRVRDKFFPNLEYTILHNGYVAHDANTFYDDGYEFTSKGFEKVN